jgi:hypothetical protein
VAGTGFAPFPHVDRRGLRHSEHRRTGTVALREAVAEWPIEAKPTDSMLEQTMHRLIT